MKLRGPGEIPDGLRLDHTGMGPQIRLPAGWRILIASLSRPWLALAVLSSVCGLAWRFLAASQTPPLLLLLDWLGLAIWFSGIWLADGMAGMLSRNSRLGLSGSFVSSLTGMLSIGMSTLVAALALAGAFSGLLLAYQPAEELIQFFDAEHRHFQVSLGAGLLGMLLTVGTARMLFSAALLLMLRRLGRAGTMLWVLISALLHFGLLSGHGWLSTLGLRPASESLRALLQPGLGGILRVQLLGMLQAEEHYQYAGQVWQGLALLVIAMLGGSLLTLLFAQCIYLAGRWRTAPGPRPEPAWIKQSAWAGVLLASLLGLGRALWFSTHPGAVDPASPELISSAGLAGALAIAWLAAWSSPAANSRIQLSDLWRLLCLGLCWLGLCTVAVNAGETSSAKAALICAAALLVLLSAFALLRLALVLRGILRRQGLDDIGDAALLLCGLFMLVPIAGQSTGAASLLAWLADAFASPGLLPLASALLGGLGLGSGLVLYLIQRSPAKRTKALPPRADTGN